jgi:diguanylate cyclase (GGDEF)-like protein
MNLFAQGTGHLRILVVDDDEIVRQALAQALRELGFDCASARNGFEALDLQRVKPFDIVLCDWLMPGMDGLELCRRIRRHDKDAYTYFIFVTGLVDQAHVVEALRGGADEYITKPVNLEELRARLVPAVRITLANRLLRKQNATLRRGSERSFKAARVDPLTEVGNRLRLREDLEALLARASRYGHRYCLALCDIDWFKHYNDHFGHLAGDAALRRVAESIEHSVRRGDTVYRYGGEEFVVILPQQSLTQAAAVMDRVRERVERLGLTISIGIAELSEAEASPDAWLERADKALYRAKANGRNRVELDDVPPTSPSSVGRSLRYSHVQKSPR